MRPDVICAAVGGLTFLIGWLVRSAAEPRTAGIPIKLRHQDDTAGFVVGQVLDVEDPIYLGCLGATYGTGTVECELVVTRVDWPRGEIWVAPR